VSSPYREQSARELCQQRVRLPVAQIESDGLEISHRTCSRLTSEQCARCGRPLCQEHCPPPERRCDRCEAQLERLLAARLGDAVLLTARQRRTQIALVVALAAATCVLVLLPFGLIHDAPIWLVAPGLAVSAMALHAAEPIQKDRAARRLLSRAREKFLRESASER
jgi:hypothetical protein